MQLVGIGFVFASYSDIRVFSGNNEYSYSFSYPNTKRISCACFYVVRATTYYNLSTMYNR